MTGPTHRQYGICFAYIASILIYKFSITDINYYLVVMMMLVTAKAGALYPDIDHDWSNVHDKTILNKILNTIIHATGGKHRSWQTHSIDTCAYYVLLSIILPEILFNNNIISYINKEILAIVMIGFGSGYVSHIFADMLTSAGVRLVCFSKFKVKFVPRKLGPIIFNTGNSWEAFNYKVIKTINLILGLVCILYPLITYTYNPN